MTSSVSSLFWKSLSACQPSKVPIFFLCRMSTDSSSRVYRPPLSSRPGSRPPLVPGVMTRPRSRSSSRSSSRPRRSTSVDRTPTPPPPGCICTRAYGTVFCKSCGWLCQTSRVRMPCPVHLRTIYLMDISQCPICKAFPPVLTEFAVQTN